MALATRKHNGRIALHARKADARQRDLNNNLKKQLADILTAAQKEELRARILVSMFDGSVRLVSAGISPETWDRALQPNDGMTPGIGLGMMVVPCHALIHGQQRL